MWSLHAEQTCQVDDAQLLAKGLALVQSGQGGSGECEAADTDFKLYSASSRQTGEATTCVLKCKDGWYLDGTPTMSCGNGADDTEESGAPSYTACQSKSCIANRSHNVIVCRIGDLLW